MLQKNRSEKWLTCNYLIMSNEPQNFSLSIFIISWRGKHENAKFIANNILEITKDVTIIFSDPDPEFTLEAPCPSIRRSDDLFWEDKFLACIDNFDGRAMLVIHADCDCDDWKFLIKRCIEINLKYKDIGVWAPKIEGTDFPLSCTKLLKIEKTELNIVAITDAIIFSLSAKIIDRMRQVEYGKNIYGWGIGLLFCAVAHLKEKLVLVDEKVQVTHPRSRGYDFDAAASGRSNFFKQFSISERTQCNLLLGYVRLHKLKARIEKDKS